MAPAAALEPAAAPLAFHRYDRRALRAGIVHIGVGAFHRGHQAVYTDDCIAAGDMRWGIVGVSLKRPDMRDLLQPQDGLYSLIERDGDGHRVRVIGSLLRVLVAPESPRAVLDALCAPDARICTLTITEKGYCLGADGQLDLAHPDVAADLARPDSPRSAIGFVAAALRQRRAAGAPALAVLSCDNLRANGHTLRRAVQAFTRQAWPGEDAAWLETQVAFPNSMVDRIVPATQPVDLADAAAALGAPDRAPVRCEPFTQWVIEHFDGERPAWEQAGAQFVDDVSPFEAAKLRLLNAAHTALACIGALHGHQTIAQSASDPRIAAFVRELMTQELAPSVRPAPGLDLAAYQASLWRRFTNPALGHGTHQVASDTSIKITQRHLPVIRERLAAGLPVDHLATVVAAWALYLRGRDLQGRPYTVNDPATDAWRQALAPMGDNARAVEEALALWAQATGLSLSHLHEPVLAAARQAELLRVAPEQ